MIQKDLLEKFNIPRRMYKNANVKWKDLINIRRHYISIKDSLMPVENIVINRLRMADRVHSVRGRIKNPDNLIAKIIRKKNDSPKSVYTVENYRKKIRDLVATRALHLYKEDWQSIHEFIPRSCMK
jgi:ppGpp synthetase/RelA/SpoT-type nucleotidyltranferase